MLDLDRRVCDTVLAGETGFKFREHTLLVHSFCNARMQGEERPFRRERPQVDVMDLEHSVYAGDEVALEILDVEGFWGPFHEHVPGAERDRPRAAKNEEGHHDR